MARLTEIMYFTVDCPFCLEIDFLLIFESEERKLISKFEVLALGRAGVEEFIGPGF